MQKAKKLEIRTIQCPDCLTIAYIDIHAGKLYECSFCYKTLFDPEHPWEEEPEDDPMMFLATFRDTTID
jgi:hypothetical protein